MQQQQKRPPSPPSDTPSQQQQPKAISKGTINVGRNFAKAKRMVTKLVTTYFAELKQELIQSQGKFVYNRDAIVQIQTALAKVATIRYTQLSSLSAKKNEIADDYLVAYLPEAQKMIKYNLNIHNINNQRPRELDIEVDPCLKLPDSGTPAVFGPNAYFFDGATFDIQKMVYIPCEVPIKISLITGQMSPLPLPPFPRIKSTIIRTKQGFVIAGGFAGPQRIITKSVLFFNTKTQSFSQLPSLNLLHNCPSGCLHNNNIYIFSDSGIQIYSQQNKTWKSCPQVSRLVSLPFEYSISISPSQILFLGGIQNNHKTTNIKLLNTQKWRVDFYGDVLPMGVGRERCWGPMVIGGYVNVMTMIQASIFPHVAIKRNAAGLVVVGGGGCWTNVLMCGND